MKPYVKYIVLAALVLGLVFCISRILDLKDRASTAEHNLAVQKDSVHYVQLKNGQLMAERESYILKEKELQEYLDISNKDRKDLEKKLGSSLKEIAKLKGNVKIDTVKTTIIKDSIIYKPDSLIYVKFMYGDEWLDFRGDLSVTPDSSGVALYDVNIPLDVTVGWSKKGKFFITTPNPYVNFGKIDAAQLGSQRQNQKRWYIGLQGGMYVIYDTPRKRVATGPGFGFGIGHSF